MLFRSMYCKCKQLIKTISPRALFSYSGSNNAVGKRKLLMIFSPFQVVLLKDKLSRKCIECPQYLSVHFIQTHVLVLALLEVHSQLGATIFCNFSQMKSRN